MISVQLNRRRHNYPDYALISKYYVLLSLEGQPLEREQCLHLTTPDERSQPATTIEAVPPLACPINVEIVPHFLRDMMNDLDYPMGT